MDQRSSVYWIRERNQTHNTLFNEQPRATTAPTLL